MADEPTVPPLPQLLRGSKAHNDRFTGPEGSLTYDRDRKTVRAHDGETPGGSSLVGEAPEDGQQYVRQDAGWQPVDVPESGIQEAPIDGQPYVRQDGSWSVAETPTVDVQEAPTDGQAYVRQDASWQLIELPESDVARNVWSIDYDAPTVPDDVGSGVTATIDGNTAAIHILTCTANTTIKFTLEEGQGVTLHLRDANLYLITWHVDVWVAMDGPPTLTPHNVFEFWRINGVIYAGHVGNAA